MDYLTPGTVTYWLADPHEITLLRLNAHKRAEKTAKIKLCLYFSHRCTENRHFNL